MRLLDYFQRSRRKSASVARDRLQIIVARGRRDAPGGARDYLPLLHQELVQVIAKYEQIDPERVTVNLDRTGGCEVLELNIVLPEQQRPTENAQSTGSPVAATAAAPTLQ